MRKVVTKDEAESGERWYGSIRILTDGRVRFSAEPGPVPALSFGVQRYHHEVNIPGAPDQWVYDSGHFSIEASRHGEAVLYLFLKRSRMRSACFSYILAPLTLRRAVADLLKTGNGVERWLGPALEHTQRMLARSGSNPALLKAIPAVLRSLEGIPRPRPARTASKRKAPSRKATPGSKAGQRRRTKRL